MASPSTCTHKPVLLPLLLLSVSLCAPYHLLLAADSSQDAVAADSSHDAVVDTDGNKLQAGTKYYILPVIFAKGGGVTLSPRNPTLPTCPLDVVQEPSEVNNGYPVTFSPADKKKGVILLSKDLYVKFPPLASNYPCPQSTVWRLDRRDGKYLISTGGDAEGKLGPKTPSSLFRIEKQHSGYKLSSCSKKVCKDVGIYKDRYGTRHLALSDEPFPVIFQKAGA